MTKSKAQPLAKVGDVRVNVFKQEASANRLLEQLLGGQKRSTHDLLEPPIALDKLAALFDVSAYLRPNIEAYVTNIDAQGHRFRPSLDLSAPDVRERVRDSLFVAELQRAQLADKTTAEVGEPDDEFVDAAIRDLRRQARLELARVRAFFASCCPDGTFTELRKKMRQDLEMTGNGYWEMLRSEQGELTAMHHVSAVRIRIAGQADDVVVTTRRRLTDILWEKVKVRRTFKRYAEVDPDTGFPVAWFRDFGDPRVMSRKTGIYYRDVPAMAKKEPDAIPATELFHFEIFSTVSRYGMPRWDGNLPAILGSRELDETNLDYFLSNAVPALALLCSGGRFAKGIEERLKEFFENEVRGRRSTHKLVILEAETQRKTSSGPSAVPKLELIPLREAQVQDGLFQQYDERNARKVAASFRLPISFTLGRVSEEDLRLTEDQVFQPEREWFDDRINRFVLPELGVELWEFRSNSTTAHEATKVGELALRYGEKGFLMPAEVRRIAEHAFRMDLPNIAQKWAIQPMPFTLAAFGLRAGPAEAVREQGRQAGDIAPVDQLFDELGLSPDEAVVASGRSPEVDVRAPGAPLAGIRPLGRKPNGGRAVTQLPELEFEDPGIGQDDA
jgi:capsid portal protein